METNQKMQLPKTAAELQLLMAQTYRKILASSSHNPATILAADSIISELTCQVQNTVP